MSKKEVMNFRVTRDRKREIQEAARTFGLSVTELIDKALDLYIQENPYLEPVSDTTENCIYNETLTEQGNKAVYTEGVCVRGLEAKELVLNNEAMDDMVLVSDGWLWVWGKTGNGNGYLLRAIGEVQDDDKQLPLRDLYRKYKNGTFSLDSLSPTQIVTQIISKDQEDRYPDQRLVDNRETAISRLTALLELDWFNIDWILNHSQLKVEDDIIWADTQPQSLFLAPSLEALVDRFDKLRLDLAGLSGTAVGKV